MSEESDYRSADFKNCRMKNFEQHVRNLSELKISAGLPAIAI